MLKYKVVVGFAVDELVETVEEHIAEGFRPVGGVAVSNEKTNSYEAVFLQAMTKETSDTPPIAETFDPVEIPHT